MNRWTLELPQPVFVRVGETITFSLTVQQGEMRLYGMELALGGEGCGATGRMTMAREGTGGLLSVMPLLVAPDHYAIERSASEPEPEPEE
jgi:hypothetical protein